MKNYLSLLYFFIPLLSHCAGLDDLREEEEDKRRKAPLSLKIDPADQSQEAYLPPDAPRSQSTPFEVTTRKISKWPINNEEEENVISAQPLKEKIPLHTAINFLPL